MIIHLTWCGVGLGFSQKEGEDGEDEDGPEERAPGGE